jgi:hypothetical protein
VFPMVARQFPCSVSVCSGWLPCGANRVANPSFGAARDSTLARITDSSSANQSASQYQGRTLLATRSFSADHMMQ